jgi:hypothetical protein
MLNRTPATDDGAVDDPRHAVASQASVTNSDHLRIEW